MFFLAVLVSAVTGCTTKGFSCQNDEWAQFCDEKLQVVQARKCLLGCDKTANRCKQQVASAIASLVTASEYFVSNGEQIYA